MSDYTKLTNYAVKDGYTTGNPAKLVKGTELDDEFNAIATAVATKFDSTDGAAIVSAIGTTTVTNATNAVNSTNATNATKVVTTNFTVEQSGADLIFKHNGTTIASMSSTGAMTFY